MIVQIRFNQTMFKKKVFPNFMWLHVIEEVGISFWYNKPMVIRNKM